MLDSSSEYPISIEDYIESVDLTNVSASPLSVAQTGSYIQNILC
jgi:hypothetical protein